MKKAAEDDMKTYGAGVADEASRTYRKVLESVFTELAADGGPRGETEGGYQGPRRLICWPSKPRPRK